MFRPFMSHITLPSLSFVASGIEIVYVPGCVLAKAETFILNTNPWLKWTKHSAKLVSKLVIMCTRDENSNITELFTIS